MNLDDQVDALQITLMSHTSIDRSWLDDQLGQLRAAIHSARVFHRVEGRLDEIADAD